MVVRGAGFGVGSGVVGENEKGVIEHILRQVLSGSQLQLCSKGSAC